MCLPQGGPAPAAPADAAKEPAEPEPPTAAGDEIGADISMADPADEGAGLEEAEEEEKEQDTLVDEHINQEGNEVMDSQDVD